MPAPPALRASPPLPPRRWAERALVRGALGAAAAIVVLGMSRAAAQVADGIDERPAAAASQVAAPTGRPNSDAASDEPGGGGPIVATPSVLPGTGTNLAGPDVRLGNLGGALSRSLSGALGGIPPSSGNGRAFSVTPQISVTEEYSSDGTGTNGGLATGRARGDFISIVQPSVAIVGETTRVQAQLFYAPQVELYIPDGNQNRVLQNFNGRVLATLVPQTLFFDLRGTASTAPTVAASGPADTTSLGRNDTTQQYSFSASPYAVHRFGPLGTAELGGSVSRTLQNALQSTGTLTAAQLAVQAATRTALEQLGVNTNQNVTTYGGHLAFTTGEAFGRYSGAALAQATSFSGTGVLHGAYRDTVTLDNGYAITRNVTALATVGYERIHYAGSNPIRISDEILSGGVRLIPNEQSTIVLRYGHQDGLDSVMVDAAYQPTVRTRVYARYSTGLTTEAELLQNALATSDLDALGNPVDHASGAPLVAVGNFFGTQNSVFKTTLASVTGVLLLDRDSISASVNSQTQTLASASSAVGLATLGTRGVYGAVSWSHELRQALQSTLYLQYGDTSSQVRPGSNRQLLVASATLSYALSRTLSGQFQYSYNRNFGSAQAPLTFLGLHSTASGGQNLVLLSLAKSF